VSAARRVIVVGGGIAGLAAAHRLRTLAPGVAITLVESDNRLGGKIVTERRNEFIIEGGPDSFLSYKPWGLALCRELGLENRLQGADEATRRTYVMRRGRLHVLPEGFTGLIPSRLGPLVKTALLSPLAKLRMALEYFIPPRPADGDESVAGFVTRRLGRAPYVRLIEPLMAGIYAGDGEQLSLEATFPQLRALELEHGGLLRGLLAARRHGGREGGTPRAPERAPAPRERAAAAALSAAAPASPGARQWPPFLTLEGGLIELVSALVTRLEGVELRLHATGRGLGRSGRGYTLRLDGVPPLEAEAVIVATPAFAAADLLADLDREAAATLRAIPHVSTATVTVAYPLSALPRPLAGHGYIVPRVEGRPILACTWTSRKFPHRAPAGFALMRAFLGRAGREDLLERDDEELVDLVREELREVLGLTAPPLFSRLFRWPRSMPQYTLGHLERLGAIEERLRAHPGLFLAGAAYRGIGIPDCIQSGRLAAERAGAFVAASGAAAAPLPRAASRL
jgi:oxygen-dependent protoporphyrinogen oxidase